MDWQIVSGISSTLIALCALGYTIWQGKQLQKHNRLSVKPHLTSWFHRNYDKGEFAFNIKNNGLGPALIVSFKVLVDGKEVKKSEYDPIERAIKMLFPSNRFNTHNSHMVKGYSMMANEECNIFRVKFNDFNHTKENFMEIEANFDRANLVIVYESFYGEEFIYSSIVEKSNNND